MKHLFGTSKLLFLLLTFDNNINNNNVVHGFVVMPDVASTSNNKRSSSRSTTNNLQMLSGNHEDNNIYDNWRSRDAIVDTTHLDDANVRSVLHEFVHSNHGKLMFGCHPTPSSHGITGSIGLDTIDGPTVSLTLEGKFWHRRETILGFAAMWLNARIPEIIEVYVEDPEELKDFRDVHDKHSQELLYVEDKRAPDFNGDRETMEYQGIDPDLRGPFHVGTGGFRPGGSMINPA